MSNLDLEFVRRAERVTSFNLATKDFESLAHKAEIQHLFNKHFFPKFDLTRTLRGVNKSSLNALVSELKRLDSGAFKALYTYNLKGVGPGEVMLYFMINDAHLGGGSSAGVDLVTASGKYEVKAIELFAGTYARNFKLGGTVPVGDIAHRLNKLRESLNLTGSKTEISKTTVDQMRDKSPKGMLEIEESFAETAYQHYFKNHDVIFINNSSTGKMGNVEAVKRVQKADVFIERLTSGTVKPMVKL